MELYYGIVPLRDDDLFSVERLLDQPRKMRLGFVDRHLLYAPKLANFMSIPRRDERDLLAAVPAIYPEVRVRCQNSAGRVNFGKRHEAGVGEGHGNILIGGLEPCQAAKVIRKLEIYRQHASLHPVPHSSGIASVACQQELRFNQYGFASQKGRVQAAKLFLRPRVVLVTGIQRRNKRSGVNEETFCHVRNPPQSHPQAVRGSWRGRRVHGKNRPILPSLQGRRVPILSNSRRTRHFA